MSDRYADPSLYVPVPARIDRSPKHPSHRYQVERDLALCAHDLHTRALRDAEYWRVEMTRRRGEAHEVSQMGYRALAQELLCLANVARAASNALEDAAEAARLFAHEDANDTEKEE